MEHQPGHTYRRGGGEESVQEGRALSVPGGQGQRQTKAAQKDHQHKAQDDHLERGNVSVYLFFKLCIDLPLEVLPHIPHLPVNLLINMVFIASLLYL